MSSVVNVFVYVITQALQRVAIVSRKRHILVPPGQIPMIQSPLIFVALELL